MSSSLKGVGIAITRPTDQAKKLSRLISDEGGLPIGFPLIEIAPLQDYSQFDTTIGMLDAYDWAIFISSNAVQYGMPRVLKQFAQLPPTLKFAAIGPVTADELKQMGVAQVLIPNGRFDSEALLSQPEMSAVQNKKVVIFRGVGGRELLADTLKARGAEVNFAECYQRINPQDNCSVLEQLWREQKLHAIVITSSEAMRHLLQLTHQGNDDWLRSIKVFVNHARIAEIAQPAGLAITVAHAVGDEAMLDCLKQTLAENTPV